MQDTALHKNLCKSQAVPTPPTADPRCAAVVTNQCLLTASTTAPASTLPCRSWLVAIRNVPAPVVAHTHSPLPSQTRIFRRLRWALQNKKRCPLRGSHNNRFANQAIQALEALAHVRGSGREIDPCSCAQSKHGLHPLQHTHQTLSVCTSKSRCTSIRRPPHNTTASPQLACWSAGGFLMVNSTGTNRPSAEALLVFLFPHRFFRWRSSVLKLKPRLWQNSLGRMPLLRNSATSCRTAARVRRLRAPTCCSSLIHPT